MSLNRFALWKRSIPPDYMEAYYYPETKKITFIHIKVISYIKQETGATVQRCNKYFHSISYENFEENNLEFAGSAFIGTEGTQSVYYRTINEPAELDKTRTSAIQEREYILDKIRIELPYYNAQKALIEKLPDDLRDEDLYIVKDYFEEKISIKCDNDGVKYIFTAKILENGLHFCEVVFDRDGKCIKNVSTDSNGKPVLSVNCDLDNINILDSKGEYFYLTDPIETGDSTSLCQAAATETKTEEAAAAAAGTSIGKVDAASANQVDEGFVLVDTPPLGETT